MDNMGGMGMGSIRLGVARKKRRGKKVFGIEPTKMMMPKMPTMKMSRGMGGMKGM